MTTVKQTGVVGWSSGENVARGYHSIVKGPAGTYQIIINRLNKELIFDDKRYFLTITDANGCQRTSEIPIAEPTGNLFTQKL